MLQILEDYANALLLQSMAYYLIKKIIIQGGEFVGYQEAKDFLA